VLGDVEWSSLSVPGAFIIGAIVSGAAVLHLVRSVVTMFDRREHRRDDDESTL
jgi:Ni/Fe-hydrogenase subunit HybB-like protein